MIGGIPLGFAEPLVLIGLLTLPALWWLLRLVPPRPRRIDFPPTRLLMEIAPREETPARTPWWLTLLRLLLAALVIVAAAGPLWNPPLATTASRAPIAILIDDGWTAAATWDARLRTADDIITRAESDRRAGGAHPPVGGHARYFVCAGGFRARAPATHQAEAAYGRPHGRDAGRSRASSPRPAKSNWSGSPMASISATAAISPRAWRRWSIRER